MADDPTPPAAGDAGQQDNATIRQMRAQIEAHAKALKDATDEAAALKAEKTTRERAELAEVDRLKAELADVAKVAAEAETLRNERGQFESAFKGLYDQELAAAPETARASLEKLSAAGQWPQRLESLREAKGLLASAMPPAARAAGTTTQPGQVSPPAAGGAPPVTPPPPLNVNERQGIGAVLRRPGAEATAG